MNYSLLLRNIIAGIAVSPGVLVERQLKLFDVNSVSIRLELDERMLSELLIVHPALRVLLDESRDQVSTRLRDDFPGRERVRSHSNLLEEFFLTHRSKW